MIRWPRSIEARLTFGYALAFAIGLVVFAAVSAASLDAALKAVIDARVTGTAALVAATLRADPSVDHATRERVELLTGSNMHAVVFSGRGRAIYSSVDVLPPALRALIMRAGDTSRIAELPIGDGEARIATQRFTTVGGGRRYVGVWRQLDLVRSLEGLRIVALAVTAAAICGSAVLVGSLVARAGLLPLRDMAALASEIEAHDLSRRLDIRDEKSELGRMGATFNRMLARLESAFDRQRRFTADASHELRAPLAVIRIAAESALRRERDPEHYQRVLGSIVRATQHLDQVTDGLLLAARADAGYLASERLDLSEVVAETVERMRPLAEKKDVALVAELTAGAAVRVDRQGVARAIVILLDNAIKFSPAGGSVTAVVAAGERCVRLAVRDRGPGFTPDGLLRATDRFWRSDPGGGSGLGLAICESIVRASGGTLVPENARDGGANVVIEFPPAA